MTCTVAGSRVRRHGKNAEVAGTWDYKWPRGTRIRVAFQRSTDVDEKGLGEAIARFVDLGRRWERRAAEYLEQHPELDLHPTEFAQTCVGFDFSPNLIFDGALGTKKEVPVGSELRSPFLREELDRRDYDVLVSFAKLPLVRHDPFRSPISLSSIDPEIAEEQAGTQRVVLPFSELGSYAKRVDYGQPTAFLGNAFKFLDVAEPKAYLDTVAGAHVVVHELGHVLGLPHTHQAPQYSELSFRPVSDIVTIFEKTFGFSPIPERFVREQVTLRWRGNEAFSDWPLLGPLRGLESVMAYPSISELLVSSTKNATAISEDLRGRLRELESKAAASGQDSLVLTQPTDTDIEMLLIMYGPSRVRKTLLGTK